MSPVMRFIQSLSLLVLYALAPATALSQVKSNASQRDSLVRYNLTVKVLPDARRFEITGTMRLPAQKRPRDFVEFSLSDVMQDLHVEITSPRTNAGIVNVTRARTEGGFLVPGGSKNQDVVYKVQPQSPFAAGEAIELTISYFGADLNGFLLYAGPEVSFASAYGTTWYPQYTDLPQGIGSLKISVPAGQIAFASGAKRSSAAEESNGFFVFEHDRPTFFSFASGNYTIARREGRPAISVYLLSHRENIPQYLDKVNNLLSVLEEEFGPYRFDEFALVEIPRAIAQHAGFNAASLQGFIFVNSNAFNVPASRFNALLEWYGHEFSHQWWPHVVSLKRPGGRFIEESLAEYGGVRAVEVIAGDSPAERLRRQGYEPDPIYSALEYFKLAGKGIDAPLGDVPADEKFRNVVYNKGLFVWDMLSREIGRTKFQHVLKDITKRYAFRKLTLKELWREIERGSGRDLGWFYEQWFERTGAPDFHLDWKQTGNMLHVAVTQPAPYYRVTLPIEIEGSSTPIDRAMKVRSAVTELTLRAPFKVKTVVLDPHYFVLRWTPEYRAAVQAAH